MFYPANNELKALALRTCGGCAKCLWEAIKMAIIVINIHSYVTNIFLLSVVV